MEVRSKDGHDLATVSTVQAVFAEGKLRPIHISAALPSMMSQNLPHKGPLMYPQLMPRVQALGPGRLPYWVLTKMILPLSIVLK